MFSPLLLYFSFDFLVQKCLNVTGWLSIWQLCSVLNVNINGYKFLWKYSFSYILKSFFALFILINLKLFSNLIISPLTQLLLKNMFFYFHKLVKSSDLFVIISIFFHCGLKECFVFLKLFWSLFCVLASCLSWGIVHAHLWNVFCYYCWEFSIDIC